MMTTLRRFPPIGGNPYFLVTVLCSKSVSKETGSDIRGICFGWRYRMSASMQRVATARRQVTKPDDWQAGTVARCNDMLFIIK